MTRTAASPKVIVVTGCDANHYGLAQGLIASLSEIADRTFDIGFVQVDSTPAPAEITDSVQRLHVLVPDNLEIWGGKGFLLAALAVKARLPEFFPGYDVYVWLDGDTWIQQAAGLDEIISQAAMADVCINPQIDRAYFKCNYPDDYTAKVYVALFGRATAERMVRRVMFNSGVFAAQASSPLWEAWRDLLYDVRDRIAADDDRFFSDQIPLHYLIHMGRLRAHPMRAVNNWLVLHGPPIVEPRTGRLLTPYAPHEVINIVHLIGSSKRLTCRVGGRTFPLTYAGFRDMSLYVRSLSGGV